MLASLKQIVRRYAPPGLKHAIRKWNSWRLVRDFDESRWPPAAAVRQLIRPGDRVVDAGANIGYVTSLLSRWVGPSGWVYSMEPEPGTFDVLSANVRRLNLGNIELFQCAVSSREGEGALAIPEYADGGENLYEARVVGASEGSSSVRTVGIKLASLDQLLGERIEALALIKLDVEGSELDAVRGAEQLIRRFHPALVIEVSGDPWDSGSRAAALFEFLTGCGYKRYVWSGGAWHTLKTGESVLDVFFLTASPPSL